MPQGGRPAPKKKTAVTLSASKQQADASGTAWQRSSGGFSGSAKKEYLKWKRQQKASRADDDSDGQDPPVHANQQDKHKPQAELPEAAAGQQKELQAPHAAASSDDVAQPLHYRPLAAVPAAPFTNSGDPLSSSAAAGPALQDHASTGQCVVEQPVASSNDQAVTYMPRLDPAEVGFTPEGFLLDMPTRPRWQVCITVFHPSTRLPVGLQNSNLPTVP